MSMKNMSFPAQSLRTPLTKGFPTNNNSSGSNKRAVSIAGKRGSGSNNYQQHLPSQQQKNSRVEDEYIRNLQQQVYLLELETRYLKAPQGEHMDPRTNSGHSVAQDYMHISSQSAPLNDAIKNLKYKYVELQEKNKKETQKLEEESGKLKTELSLQTIAFQNVEKERQELLDTINHIKEHNTMEKDKLYGEALQLRKKLQTSQGDLSRMELSYQRLNTERSKLITENTTLKDEQKKFHFQIEEQININNALKSRIEEFRRQNTELTSQMEDLHATYSTFDMDKHKARINDLLQEVKDLKSQALMAETRQQQEEHLRMRAMEDCSELVKSNTNLKCELDEVQRRLRREFEQREEKLRHKQDRMKDVEESREELSRAKDELSMMKISLESKDNKIHEYVQKNKSLESAMTKALDTQRVLEDRIVDIENRIRIGEAEVIQLGQDKSLLIDDVAELRNNTEINSSKVKTLMKEKQELQVELAKYQREMVARKEFSHMIQELEHSGENYLSLMRNMKAFTQGGGNSSNNGIDRDDIHSAMGDRD